jgi:hypothetical protein
MSSNPNSSDFSYKKYSLEQLDNWVHDALNCEDLTAQDIYDTIVKCVDDMVEYHKKELTKTTDLLSLLKGHRPTVDFDYTATGEKFPLSCNKDDKSPECQRSWNDFWEENYYPEEYYSNQNQNQYTEEELNAMCDKAASDQEKQKCREYNLREAEYYDKRAKLDAEYAKTKKWTLPVEVVRDEDTDKDEYCVTFPDDLLEAANLKEGDEIEWIDLKNGSYQLRKVTKTISPDEC